MGCGCGKKGVVRKTPSLRASVGPKSIARGTVGPTPSDLRTLNMQNVVSNSDSKTMDAQRRRIEKLRRDAIKKKLNK